MEDFTDWLGRAVKKSSKSQRAISLELKRNGKYIADLLKRGNTPSFDMISKIAKVLDADLKELVGDTELVAQEFSAAQIPILGEVKAGNFLLSDPFQNDFEPTEYFPYAFSPDMKREGIYALRVVGTSMNKVAPEGSILVCHDIYWSGISLNDGDMVVVERRRHDLIELTAKRYRNNGRIELWPESDDPEWQEPYTVGDMDGDEVIVKAVVRGIYFPSG